MVRSFSNALRRCDGFRPLVHARIDYLARLHQADHAHLEAPYYRKQILLHVAYNRARDKLFVTGFEPASEFLDNFANVNRVEQIQHWGKVRHRVPIS